MCTNMCNIRSLSSSSTRQLAVVIPENQFLCSGVNCEENFGGGARLWKLSWIWQTHRVYLGNVSVCSIQGGTGLERLFLILLELREQRHYVCHTRKKISSIGRLSCTFWFFLVQRGRSCDSYHQLYCLEQGCFCKQREHRKFC